MPPCRAHIKGGGSQGPINQSTRARETPLTLSPDPAAHPGITLKPPNWSNCLGFSRSPAAASLIFPKHHFQAPPAELRTRRSPTRRTSPPYRQDFPTPSPALWPPALGWGTALASPLRGSRTFSCRPCVPVLLILPINPAHSTPLPGGWHLAPQNPTVGGHWTVRATPRSSFPSVLAPYRARDRDFHSLGFPMVPSSVGASQTPHPRAPEECSVARGVGQGGGAEATH